jgi:hypothetical protein
MPFKKGTPPLVQGAARRKNFQKNGGPIGGCALDKGGPWAREGGYLQMSKSHGLVEGREGAQGGCASVFEDAFISLIYFP